jgi:hypothetical protein
MIKTVPDVFPAIEQLRADYPDFKHPSKMPEAQDEYFANIATAISKLSVQVPEDWKIYDEKLSLDLQSRFDRLLEAVRSDNYEAFDAVCREVIGPLDRGPDRTDPNIDPVGCSHDPGCGAIDGQILWFYVTKCFTKWLCISKHAALSTTKDAIILGHCDNKASYPECKCIPWTFPLSVLIFLLTVILFFFAGPAMGAAGREALRQLVTRLAPAA